MITEQNISSFSFKKASSVNIFFKLIDGSALISVFKVGIDMFYWRKNHKLRYMFYQRCYFYSTEIILKTFASISPKVGFIFLMQFSNLKP
jgi:hypothetical protein